MNNSKIKPIIVIIVGLLLTTGCEDSTGSQTPESATISGTITFTGIDNWPTDGPVALSLSSAWPPTGAPAASSVITESELSSGTYAYTFENVTFGTYKAIAVSWQNPDTTYNSTCNQSTLGAFGGSVQNYFMTPDSLTASTENYELTGNDFDANLNYALPNPYSICQPPCVAFTTETECTVENIYQLSMGHCIWDATNSSCGYKQ